VAGNAGDGSYGGGWRASGERLRHDVALLAEPSLHPYRAVRPPPPCDGQFLLERQPVGVSIRPAGAVGQAFHPTVLVAVEDLVAGAGDIGVGVEGMRWAARHFPVRPVIYVPGNHEFYGHDIDLTAELEAAAPENITLLSDDVLLLHDAPAGVEFTWRRKDGSVRRRYESEAEGLAQAVARTRPRVCFFGHHHTGLDAEIAGVRCIGLNKVAMPGNLVALDVPARGRGYEILGEWPGREQIAS